MIIKFKCFLPVDKHAEQYKESYSKMVINAESFSGIIAGSYINAINYDNNQIIELVSIFILDTDIKTINLCCFVAPETYHEIMELSDKETKADYDLTIEKEKK